MQLNHPYRHNQIIAVESAEFVCYAEDGAGAKLKGELVNHVKDTSQAFIRRGSFFDLQWTELAITLKDDINLLGIAVAVKVKIRLQPCVLIAFL